MDEKKCEINEKTHLQAYTRFMPRNEWHDSARKKKRTRDSRKLTGNNCAE